MRQHIVSEIVMCIIAFLSLRVQYIEIRIIFVAISLFLLRPLYLGFDTIVKREVNDAGSNILYVKIGMFIFKINKERSYISVENVPIMIYGPAAINTGYNICIVRNNKSFWKRLIKNKITLIHRNTLEEAENTVIELKKLFNMKDMYDVRRINYNKNRNI